MATLAKRAALVAVLAAACLGAIVGHGAIGQTAHASQDPVSEQEVSTVEASGAIVVIVTIDGVRWQEVIHGVDERLRHGVSGRFTAAPSASGLMPNLHDLAEKRGVLLGSDSSPMYTSSVSTVSLPGYMEIFAGRPTSCASNGCPATALPTLLDEWAVHDGSATLTVFSSWPSIARAAAQQPSRLTLSAGRPVQVNTDALCDDPALCELYRSGLQLSAAPGAGGYRPDRATAAVAIQYLRTKQPQFLFVGLGDTDEYAHSGDYEGYLRALHAADETVGTIGASLEARERRGARTLLICTSDHGRANGFRHHGGAPEAARVWALFAGSVVKARGHMMAPPSRLADIAPTVREFVELPSDAQPGAGRSLLPLLTRSESSHEGDRASR